MNRSIVIYPLLTMNEQLIWNPRDLFEVVNQLMQLDWLGPLSTNSTLNNSNQSRLRTINLFALYAWLEQVNDTNKVGNRE